MLLSNALASRYIRHYDGASISKMVNCCSVVGCSNRSDREKDRSFHRLPEVITHLDGQTREYSTERRNKWLSNIRRADLDGKKFVWVCSDHFTTGKPATLFQKSHPDWAPTLHLGHSNVREETSSRWERRKERVDKRTASQVEGLGQAPVALYHHDFGNIESPTPDKPENNPYDVNSSPKFRSVEIQTELSMGDLDNIEQKLCALDNENKRLKEKVVSVIPIDVQKLQQDKEMVVFLTGIPNYSLLMSLFSFLSESISQTHRNCLTTFQEFLLTMMRLRLHLPFQDLAYRFNISKSTASRIFDRWIDVMASELKFLIKWPDREELQKTMPNDFVQVYGRKVAVIIDCFEVFIERPGDLLARASTWSNYKHHITVKFLIGICPQGVISFISKAWGGRTSDKHLTENCHILNRLLPGDIVLADKGFNISESVALMGAKLEIPAFTKGKAQLSSLEVEETRRLANVRIHVERVIGLVRQKYQILNGILPIETLHSNNSTPQIDKIAIVCCSLTNICDSVVPFY